MPQFLGVRRLFAALIACAVLPFLAAPGVAAQPGAILVTLGPKVSAPHGGRLIVFASTHEPEAGKPVSFDFLHPRNVYITSIDVPSVAAGQTVRVPLNRFGFPTALANAPRGRYAFSAWLDVRGDFAYTGEPDAGDLGGPVAHSMLAPGATPHLLLNRTLPAPSLVGARGIDVVRVHSAKLSAFLGHDTTVNAVVVRPRGVAPGAKVPTAFVVGGYGSTLGVYLQYDAPRLAAMHKPMYFVLLDPEVPLGHSVFADSANNGPWGSALTTEFIPALEAKYPKMIAESRGRFLTGHSSGGWTTLWLQVNYPDVFGGTWSTAPDPVDFHSFVGPDLLQAPQQNLYVNAQGAPYNLVRYHGRQLMTVKDYIALETVEGAQGGQFRSFDAAFSPRGVDGLPVPLFNRATGAIDPTVVLAWEHYDIATILRENWPTLGPKLAGKLHIIVGTADTFHLNEAVALLDRELHQLGSDAQITYVPGRDHLDLYKGNLRERIIDAMLAKVAKARIVGARTTSARAGGE